MSDHKFGPHERFAVFTVHGERCYICRTPISLGEVEIDHLIPESLDRDRAKLARAITLLGLPADFRVNTAANWSPACRRCNGLKSDRLWEPSLLIQLHLQVAAERAAKVVELIEVQVKKREISRALNLLERAAVERRINPHAIGDIRNLLMEQRPFREEGIQDRAVMIAPEFGVISNDGDITIVRGPYGVGGRPSMPDPHPSFDCPNCGPLAAWEGARCVCCGMLSHE